MQFKNLIMAMLLLAGLSSCGGSDNGGSDKSENNNSDAQNNGFALGADISWKTEYEAAGHNFYNAAGEKRECTALMKELGLNAIRLRVWVDPKAHDNWCNKADLVAKAKTAAALDMDVMVDFHYSDWWADPGQQHKPAAWKGLSLADLKKALADHTRDVLGALKAEGITPKWVQVGNEIRPGMLWDENKSLSGASWDIKANEAKEMGWTSTEVKYPANWDNLRAFITEGYKAVKEVFPDAIAIVHLDNGYDAELYKWFFDELKRDNVKKWDMIGMSIYPYWTMQEHADYTAERTITDCIANVKAVSTRYDCDVMIVETGMECADSQGKLASQATLQNGKTLLARLIKECRENTGGRCKGVFYWEPECKPSQYCLGAFTEEGRPTVIMDAFKQ